MDRTVRRKDLITLVAMMGTVLGVFLCLLFLFAPTTLGANLPDAVVSSLADSEGSLRWAQPMLGQVIVEDALLKQQYGSQMRDAVKTLNRPGLTAHRIKDGYLPAPAMAYTAIIEADHAVRVQWVMGRMIVTLTGQGVRAGVVTADKSANEANRRIIAVARETGAKLDGAFKAEWQARLGMAIVTETLAQERLTDNSREQVGLIF
ncbi:MAG: hypothetical protein ACT4OO_15465 [Nitrospiraceae bacterium]